MAKLVLLLVCASLVYTASALTCYECSNEDCNKKNSEVVKKTCSATAPQIAVCLKHVYTDTADKEFITKKCILTSPGTPYKCDAKLGTEKYCGTCENELCNSAPSLLFTRYGLLAAVMALFVPRLFLH